MAVRRPAVRTPSSADVSSLRVAVVAIGAVVALLHTSCTQLVCRPAEDCARIYSGPAFASLVSLVPVTLALLRSFHADQEIRKGLLITEGGEGLRYLTAASAFTLGLHLCRLDSLFPGAAAGRSLLSDAFVVLCSAAELAGPLLLAGAAWVAVGAGTALVPTLSRTAYVGEPMIAYYLAACICRFPAHVASEGGGGGAFVIWCTRNSPPPPGARQPLLN